MKDKEQFLFFLLGRKLKNSSLETYKQTLKTFLNEKSELSIENLTDFINKKQEVGRSTAYLNKYVRLARHYGKFKNDTQLTHFPFLKNNKAVRHTFSDDEIEAVVNMKKPKRGNQNSWRMWSLFFKCLAFSGLRQGELRNLKFDDVNFGNNEFILTDTKINEPAFVPISPELVNELKKWVSDCQTEFLFTNSKDDRLSHQAVSKALNIRLRRLGVKRRGLTPHSFRHTFAKRMLESDVSLFHVKKLLRHKKLETTEIYLNLTTEDIHNAISKDRLARKLLSRRKKCDIILNNLKPVLDEKDKLSILEKNNQIKIVVTLPDF